MLEVSQDLRPDKTRYIPHTFFVSIHKPSREELGDKEINMAKAYESFKNDEIVSIYRFMCRINEFNLLSGTSDIKIRDAFPRSREWEEVIGRENICIVTEPDLRENPGNPEDKRYRFRKSDHRTILNALLYTIATAISVGDIEKVGKKVLITARKGDQLIANGEIPFENFKSFINLFNNQV